MITTQAPTPAAPPAEAERDRLLEGFLLALEAENRSPRTARLYRYGIKKLFAFLDEIGLQAPVSALTAEHLRFFLARQREAGLSPNSLQAIHRSLRAFWRFLAEEGEAENVMARIAAPQVEEKVVDALSDAELTQLFKVLRRDHSTLGLRDLAICAALLDSGLRCSELLSLTVADIDPRERRALVRGKGAKERIVVFEARTMQLIARYHRRISVDSGRLFRDRSGGAMSQSGLYLAVRRRGKQAGIPNLHPHRFRHSTATRLLAAGLAEQHIRALLGWSRASRMLERYTASASAEIALSARAKVRLVN